MSRPGDDGYRAYRETDRDVIVALLSESEPWHTLGYTSADWITMFARIGTDPTRETVVVVVHGAPVGIAVVRRRFLLGDYLELFAVAPSVRRQGVGRALLAHVEQIALGRGKNFFVCVSDFNTPARTFYRDLGYTEVGSLDDLLVQGRAEILLRKTTGPVRG